MKNDEDMINQMYFFFDFVKHSNWTGESQV